MFQFAPNEVQVQRSQQEELTRQVEEVCVKTEDLFSKLFHSFRSTLDGYAQQTHFKSMVKTLDSPTVKKRRNFPKRCREELKAWLIENSENPYPTSKQKLKWCNEFSLTKKQIETWFSNGRQRYLKMKKKPNTGSTKHGGGGNPIKNKKAPSSKRMIMPPSLPSEHNNTNIGRFFVGDFSEDNSVPAGIPVPIQSFPCYPTYGNGEFGYHPDDEFGDEEDHREEEDVFGCYDGLFGELKM